MEPSLRHALRRIGDGPTGPSVGAYFDLDGTLVHGRSGLSFLRNRLRHGEFPREAWSLLTRHPTRALLAAAASSLVKGDERAAAHLGATAAAHAWSTLSPQELQDLAQRVFHEELARRIIRETWLLARAHQARGHTLVIASAATRTQIEALAAALGVTQILCSPISALPHQGAAVLPMCWGDAKALAVKEHAAAHGMDLADSYAYTDGVEDLPLLQLVGNPCVIGDGPSMRRHAAAHGWPVLPVSRAARLGVPQRLAALGAGRQAVSHAAGLLGGGRTSVRTAVNAGLALGSDLLLACTGVEVRVRGRENLPGHRPTVFVANRTAALDIAILAHVLGPGQPPLVQGELASPPAVGPLLRLKDAVFADGGDRSKDRGPLGAAKDRLREGTSVLVFPENARPHTPDLGDFKSAGFLLAAQSGTPITPVVLHDVRSVAGRTVGLPSPGRVHVSILPSVDTTSWSAATIRRDTDQVRSAMLASLAEGWRPEPDPGGRGPWSAEL